MSEARKLLAAYLALLLLLALTVGSSFLDLGGFNPAVNIAIAAAKAAVIAILFMQLTQRGPLPQLAAGAVVLWLGILYWLTLAA
jgi:cytochrome c oxidase subunit 4